MAGHTVPTPWSMLPVELGKAAAFRRREKVAAIFTISLCFQVRISRRSQVCWRKVRERLQNLATLGRLFMARFGATFDTFHCLVPTSHSPALQLGRRKGRGKIPWQLLRGLILPCSGGGRGDESVRSLQGVMLPGGAEAGALPLHLTVPVPCGVTQILGTPHPSRCRC